MGPKHYNYVRMNCPNSLFWVAFHFVFSSFGFCFRTSFDIHNMGFAFFLLQAMAATLFLLMALCVPLQPCLCSYGGYGMSRDWTCYLMCSILFKGPPNAWPPCLNLNFWEEGWLDVLFHLQGHSVRHLQGHKYAWLLISVTFQSFNPTCEVSLSLDTSTRGGKLIKLFHIANMLPCCKVINYSVRWSWWYTDEQFFFFPVKNWRFPNSAKTTVPGFSTIPYAQQISFSRNTPSKHLPCHTNQISNYCSKQITEYLRSVFGIQSSTSTCIIFMTLLLNHGVHARLHQLFP